MSTKYRNRIRRFTTHSGAALITAMAIAAGPQAVVTGAQASVTGGHPVTNPFSPAYLHTYRYGVVPTVAQQQKMNQWAASHPLPNNNLSSENLEYGGGIDGIGVTTGHQKVYLVFLRLPVGHSGHQLPRRCHAVRRPLAHRPLPAGTDEGPRHRR